MNNKHLYAVIAVLAVLLVVSAVGWMVSPSQKDISTAVSTAVTKQDLATQAREAAYQAQVQAKVDALQQAQAAQLAAKDAENAKLAADLATVKTDLAKATGTLSSVTAAQEAQLAEAKARDQGYVLDKVRLGDALSFNLDQGKLPFLVDGTISFKDDNYDVQEKFTVPTGKALLAYSAIDDEDFAAAPYMILPDRGSFQYQYLFTDPVTMSEVSHSDPLRIKLLGKDVSIVSASASEVTLQTGTSYYLLEGQSVKIGDKTVTLTFVGDNSRVGVTVDGEAKVITEFSHELVGGLDISAQDILVNARAGSATLIIGNDVLVTQRNNDDYMNDPAFKFEIQSSAGQLTGLTVTYDERGDNLGDDFAPLALGKELSFPNHFINVKFDKLLNTKYVGYEVTFDKFDDQLKNGTDIVNLPAVIIHSDSIKGLSVSGYDVGEVYVGQDSTVYYKDHQGEWLQDSLANLELTNSDFTATASIVSGKLTFADAYGETLALDTNFVNETLGATKREAENSDVIYTGYNFGTRDQDILLQSGIVLKNPKSNADSDRVSFQLPSDRVEAEFFIHG